MVPGKPDDYKSYQGELEGQLGFIYVIQIIESIMGSTPSVVDICDKISAPRQDSIHP